MIVTDTGISSRISYYMNSKEPQMLYTSNPLDQKIYQFMAEIFPDLKKTDIEVIPTDLTEDNVFGWTLENNDQNEIEIHNNLRKKDYVTTLIHELVHVDQNVKGIFDDERREREAYAVEGILTNRFFQECDKV